MNDSASVVATTRPRNSTCIGTGAVTATDPASVPRSTGATGGTAASGFAPAAGAVLAASPVVAAIPAAVAGPAGAGTAGSHDASGITAAAGNAAAVTGAATVGGRKRARIHNAVGTASIRTSDARTAIAIRDCWDTPAVSAGAGAAMVSVPNASSPISSAAALPSASERLRRSRRMNPIEPLSIIRVRGRKPTRRPCRHDSPIFPKISSSIG